MRYSLRNPPLSIFLYTQTSSDHSTHFQIYDKLFDTSVPVPQSQTTSTPNVVGIEGDFQFENEQTLYQDTGNNSNHFCLNDPTSFSGSSGADIDMWPGDPSYAQDWDTFMASVEAMIQSQRPKLSFYLVVFEFS
ncbi:hypothetical protein K435DRAFT_59340 [Dendrothele bispora CBS 962.96]|uniref:Uncharacterized protein n=1 Tax=Dendrothele bispora (strain CBS 962.96) TaxID=1314807 RepID=A0A4S8KRG7_DENBC|nr:hypothetical protein K435DRAFT_59340 [Dendrothele bispora CBS 962.96]